MLFDILDKLTLSEEDITTGMEAVNSFNRFIEYGDNNVCSQFIDENNAGIIKTVETNFCVINMKEIIKMNADLIELKQTKTLEKHDIEPVVKYIHETIIPFLEKNNHCMEFAIKHNIVAEIEETLKLAEEVGIDYFKDKMGGRRKASPKYKRTRRRKSKSKKTRRR